MDQDNVLTWPCFPVKRRLTPNHILFEDGDLACHLGAKIIPVEQITNCVKKVAEFSCSISGCGKTFNTVARYESHYNTSHRNKCTVCKRVFPSNYLLEIHLLEWHDAMFEILAVKQNMYKCLLESCQEKFISSKTRKKHMVAVHHFPANYRFDRVKKNKSTPLQNITDNEQENNSMEYEESKTKTSSNRIFSYKVPKNICFGQGSTKGFARPSRGRGRGGKHWHQFKTDKDTTVNIENVLMADLTDALNSS